MTDVGVAKKIEMREKMDDKIEEVISRYPIRPVGKRRMRGAILIETQDGLFTLANYRESMKKVLFQEQVKKKLIEMGYLYVDEGIQNEEGEYLSRDAMGNHWILKRWYVGRECNIRDEREVQKAMGHLAELHRMMHLADTWGATSVTDAELLAAQTEESVPESPDFEQLSEKHMREMKRVYNYIRGKRRKNEIEICILNLFSDYYEQAGAARECLENTNYKKLIQTCRDEQRIRHGSYNYHNVLFMDTGIATTNFERAQAGVQITDLYDFLRKIMEKNNWNIRQGLSMIDAYCTVRPLEKEEAQLLYVLLLFPEKFWKQINFYYNGKKAWMSAKNYEKLQKLQKQEADRKNFLREAKSLLF